MRRRHFLMGLSAATAALPRIATAVPRMATELAGLDFSSADFIRVGRRRGFG
jgi:hypothetical protein